MGAFGINIADYLRRKRLQESLVDEPDVASSGFSPADLYSEQRSDFVDTTEPESLRSLRTLTGQAPQMSDFKPSRGRRIAAAIAGAAAGASTGYSEGGGKGASEGAKVAEGIAYSPFKRAQAGYGSRLKSAQELAKVDEEQLKLRSTMEHTRASTAAEQARRESEIAQGEHARAQTSRLAKTPIKYEPTTREEAESFAVLQHPGPQPREPKGPYTVTLKSGKKLSGVTFNNDKNAWIGPDQRVLDPNEFEDSPRTTELREPVEKGGAFERAMSAREREIGRPLTSKEIAVLNNEIVPASLTASRQATTEKTREDLDTTRATLDPKRRSLIVTNMRRSPDIFHEIDAKSKPLVAQEWMEKTGLPPPAPLPTESKNMERASYLALDHVKAIKEFLKDKEIINNLGPVLGRMNEAGEFIGTVPFQKPALERKAQDLRNRLNVLLVQEARSSTGGVAREGLVKLLRSSSPKSTMNPNLFLGALDGVEGVNKLNIANIDKERFGGTTRLGTVEYSGKEIPRFTKGPKGENLVFDENTGTYGVR